MKRFKSILIILLFVLFALSACATKEPGSETTLPSDLVEAQPSPVGDPSNQITEPSDSTEASNDQTTEPPDSTDPPASDEPPEWPEFILDIGKPYSALMSEHPTAEMQWFNAALLDAAEICLTIPWMEYMYFLFSTHSFPIEYLTDEDKEQLVCAGISTTVGVLFPQASDNMPLDAFFSAIGVSTYEHEEWAETVAAGQVTFTYNNLDVYINASSDTEGGMGKPFRGITHMKSAYPAVIIDRELGHQNFCFIHETVYARLMP